MFAVVEIAKKQYIIRPGDVLDVEKLKETSGEVTFDKVMLISVEDKVYVGAPYLEEALVKADIIGQKKSKKIIVYKCKKRKKYRRKQGHRQNYTTVKISAISSSLFKSELGLAKQPVKKPAAKIKPEKSTAKKVAAKKTTVKKAATKKTTSKKTASKPSSKNRKK